MTIENIEIYDPVLNTDEIYTDSFVNVNTTFTNDSSERKQATISYGVKDIDDTSIVTETIKKTFEPNESIQYAYSFQPPYEGTFEFYSDVVYGNELLKLAGLGIGGLVIYKIITSKK